MKLNKNNPIGGYFELELKKGKEFHRNAIALNTGRNCLEYILRVREYKKVFIPYYICDVILEPFLKTKTKYEFYKINFNLEPVGIILQKNEALLYVNYFGIKSNYIKKISKLFNNLIIDNSQAFFEKPLKNVDTFYSPRKFFGIPDGGYLYINKLLNKKIETDNSYNRFNHLLKRIDINPESGFKEFLKNDKMLEYQSIKMMSSITKKLLRSIDYNNVKDIRKRNFNYLHDKLKSFNKLFFSKTDNAPLVYPLLTDNIRLRDILIKNKIYVAKYWENVNKWTDNTYFENQLTNNLVPLPVDQRYDDTDLRLVINVISKNINKSI